MTTEGLGVGLRRDLRYSVLSWQDLFSGVTEFKQQSEMPSQLEEDQVIEHLSKMVRFALGNWLT